MRREAVVALIFDENRRVLAVSRKDDPSDFGLPGGKVDAGENAQAALRREVWEETGLTVTKADEIFIATEGDFRVSAFIVEADDLNLSTHEAGVLAWKSLEELAEHGSFRDYNRKLRDLFNDTCKGS